MAAKAGNASVLAATPAEVRRIPTRFGLFSRVDGSSYYEQGNTKVVAVVYGPRELRTAAAGSVNSGAAAVGTGSGNAASNTQPRATVNCEFTQAAFAIGAQAPTYGDRKKLEMSLAVKQIFEACIQTQLSRAITLALIDAGIALNDFVVASSAGYLQQTMLCGASELRGGGARAPQMIIALNPRTQKLNLLQMECKLPWNCCNQIYDLLQNAVRENTWKRLRCVARQSHERRQCTDTPV
ncbi:Ribosomal protein S5 domain 2-type fold [Phytophthora cactorum]|nr:Ribosomal protein S5 domain 2-type fold [Phytophthora cactorum]